MARLDIILKQRFPDMSRVFLQRIIKDGHVKVEEKVIKKPHQKVSPDAKIECGFPAPRELKIKPAKFPLEIIFEDKDIIVIDKPAGISVHPSGTERDDTLVSFLLDHCKDLSGIGGVLRPGIVHRLDKDTSGLLVVAKNDKSHTALSEQWKARSVKKEYLALVKGVLPAREGIIEAPIARSLHDRKKMAVSARKGSRYAITRYKVIKKLMGGKVSLVRVFPETGRTHQIRVHFTAIGHPVIGDALYGDSKLNREFEKEYGLRRQFLHASVLGFRHPVTKKPLSFSSKLPGVLDVITR